MKMLLLIKYDLIWSLTTSSQQSGRVPQFSSRCNTPVKEMYVNSVGRHKRQAAANNT